MTLIWFIVWLISDHTGARAPLLFHPANAWTTTLILVLALDLSAAHARSPGRSKR